jgi:hypothetical protein
MSAAEITQELDFTKRLMAAVWMVGNMDTEQDKAAWWANFEPLWNEVAQDPHVQEYADAAFAAAHAALSQEVE